MRVGRAAIDDEAIRLLEQHNPDVQFDWPRLLKEPPAEAPRREREGRERDRDRRERRDQRSLRPRPIETSAAAVPPLPTAEAAEAMQELAEAAEERAAEHAEAFANRATEYTANQATEYTEHTVNHATEYTEYTVEGAAEPTEHSDHTEHTERTEPTEHSALAEEAGNPVLARLGAEGLQRLRSRYADILGRIDRQDMDDDSRTELKVRASRLNPDAWSTPEEVADALEQYEAVFETIRSVVGRQPRPRRV